MISGQATRFRRARAKTRVAFLDGVVACLFFFAPACAPTHAASAAPPVRSPPDGPHWQAKIGADHPLVGVIWDVAAARRVSEADLTARVQAADVVLVGETHDNPDHHALEASVLAAFAARHDAPAVVFEMLDREQQGTVDASVEAIERVHLANVDALGQAVAWDSSGWPAWAMYRPVFATALEHHAAIFAGGLNRAAAMRVAGEGVAALDPALVQTFGLAAPLAADVDTSMRHEMSESHCGLLPETALGSMVLVQRARDALLAERLHEGAARGHGALLIAGAGHVRSDRGVPAQLKRAYGATSVAIGLLQATAEGATPETYAQAFAVPALPFDFVWFTPRANDVDPCEEMRKQMSAHDGRSGR